MSRALNTLRNIAFGGVTVLVFITPSDGTCGDSPETPNDFAIFVANADPNADPPAVPRNAAEASTTFAARANQFLTYAGCKPNSAGLTAFNSDFAEVADDHPGLDGFGADALARLAYEGTCDNNAPAGTQLA